MDRDYLWSRRSVLKTASLGALGALSAAEVDALADKPNPARGNLKQSVCRWCYGRIQLPELAKAARAIGYQSIELLSLEEFPTVKEAGLTCAMLRCASIPDGLNRRENHERIERELRRNIEFAAAEGIPNVICMSGNRRGMADEEGLDHCVEGLKRMLGFAEEKRVTVCMEGLNSKVDHRDYMYDRTRWGVALARKVGSPRFKLLYDIYHMQIMEGDVIRTIREAKDYIGHYHTGGNPGRNEIDESQELNYPAIVRAIQATGYTGFLGQEFIPRRDPLTSLAQGFRICDL